MMEEVKIRFSRIMRYEITRGELELIHEKSYNNILVMNNTNSPVLDTLKKKFQETLAQLEKYKTLIKWINPKLSQGFLKLEEHNENTTLQQLTIISTNTEKEIKSFVDDGLLPFMVEFICKKSKIFFSSFDVESETKNSFEVFFFF